MSSAPSVALIAPGGFLGGNLLPFFVEATKDCTFAALRLITTNPSKLVANFDTDLVAVKEVDYSNPETLESALRGVDVLGSAMASSSARKDDTAERSILHAAASAGVKVYFPSEWGFDYDDHPIEGTLFEGKMKHREAAEKLGLKTVAIAVGVFIESFFAAPTVFGINGNHWNMLGDGNKPLAMTGVKDIARHAVRTVAVVHSRPELIARRVRVYSVLKSINEYADIVERATSQPITRTYQSQEELDEIWRSGEGGARFALRRLVAATDFSDRSDVELLNPGQKYWQPVKFEDFIPEVPKNQ